MLAIFLKTFGKLLNSVPTRWLEVFVHFVGDIIFFAPTSKRKELLSNLRAAFPQYSYKHILAIGRESCRRTVEMGLFVLASPCWDAEKVKKNLKFTTNLIKILEENKDTPVIFLVPHFSLMEMITLSPTLFKKDFFGSVGIIYRPFAGKTLESWVKKTRERFGFKLLSRKQGFQDAQSILEKKGKVVILFDQNAGYEGKSIFFFDRIASATELPGMLAQKYEAKTFLAYPKRKGFWHVEVEGIPIEGSRDISQITLASNKLLEDLLKSNDNLCANWLWLHNRWKTQEESCRRFQFYFRREHRNGIQESLDFLHHSEFPKNTKFWIRMPNWLGDIVMTLPLLRAIRKARPDAEITLLAKNHFTPLLRKIDLCDHILAIPNLKSDYFKYFWDLRKHYPHTQILFTNSFRSDIEARLIGAPQRFGIKKSFLGRPLLSHVWEKPDSINESKIHQTLLWEKFLQHFGLKEKLDLSQIYLNLNPEEMEVAPNLNIGIICGTENSPEKRWSIKNWQMLIERLLFFYSSANILLFGTKKDASLTKELKAAIPSDKVINLAGKTDLVQFALKLLQCKAVISNDTGGMHLANALGIPVCVLYGPTNPIRTGPIFDSPKCIIQPLNCPAAGGLPMHLLTPDAIFEKFNSFYHTYVNMV